MDLDAVGKTENLSHGAAMHKRNVRPRHRAKTRRVSAAPAAMVSQFYRFFVILWINEPSGFAWATESTSTTADQTGINAHSLYLVHF